MSVDLGAVTQAVAAYGLPGEDERPPDGPLPDGTWEPFLSQLHGEKLTGLLAQAVADGAFPVTDTQAEQLAALQLGQLRQMLLLERLLIDVVRLLAAEGIGHRVLKGPAAAHLDYPDPMLRPFNDIDILVPSADVDRAFSLLTAAGYRRRFPEPRPGFDRRFGKGACFVTPAGLELDMHRTFVIGPWGLTIDLDDLWATRSSFSLGGHQVDSLETETRFLSACIHAALSEQEPLPINVRDIAQMLVSGSLDGGRTQKLIRSWAVEPPVARALTICRDTFPVVAGHPLIAWASRYPMTARDERRLRMSVDPTTGYARKMLSSLGAVRGVRRKLAFATTLAFPRSSYLDGRYSSRLRRWTGIVRPKERAPR